MNESQAKEFRNTPTQPGHRTLLLLAIPICLLGAALLAKGLYPAELPSVREPNFIDVAFDNRAVLWTVRLLLVSAAVVLALGGLFIVISIGMRVKNEEWLRRAGPFEVSEITMKEIEGQLDRWHTATLMGQEEVADLTERLEKADELIERFRTAFASGSMVGKEP
jgi:hypothetical protein